MTLAAWILRLLSVVPTAPTTPLPEVPNCPDVRLETIAQAAANSVEKAVSSGQWPAHRKWELASLTVSTLWYESHLDESVHAGRRWGDNNRSACLMQINRGTKYKPEQLVGTSPEKTQACLDAGVHMLAWSMKYCARKGKHSMANIATQYTFGHRCEPSPDGERRAKLARAILRVRP